MAAVAPDSLRSRRAGSVAVYGVLGAASASAEGLRHAARETARDVLARSEFRQRGTGEQSWLSWGMEQLGALFRVLGEWFTGLPNWLGLVLIIWMILTLVAILIHLLYVLFQQFGGGRGHTARATPKGQQVFGVQATSFAEAYASAQARLAAGDHGGAVRYFYLAAILWLDERALVQFGESKTNYDYVRALGPEPTTQAQFAQMTTQFELIAYAGREPTDETSRRMAAALEGLRDAAGR